MTRSDVSPAASSGPAASAGWSETELLRRLSFLSDVGHADLERLQRLARRIVVAAGDLVMREGTAGDGLYVVLEGEVEVVRREGGREIVLAVHGPGAFLGEMSLLERLPRTASVRAVFETRLMVIGPDEFESLVAASPAASLAMLRSVTARLRATEAALIQRETLASLGTLAAGLAHELNNPAAALRRSVRHLRDALNDLDRHTRSVARLDLDDASTLRLRELEAAARHPAPLESDPVRAADEERRIEDWLADRGVDEPWEPAAVLAGAGWDVNRLETLAAELPGAHLNAVVRWLAAATAGYGLLDELARSAGAVSDIVDAVRSYVYLDRAAVQPVDLRESLTNAVVILKAKLGERIAVVWDIAADLPAIEAYGGELSQVWTNLVDNAIDSMQGGGTLRLSARRSGDAVVVEISDTGPGIPPEVQPRVFDPFFTTKPPGAGSGLGLHIAYGIVVNRHRGTIRLHSAVAGTTAEVVLPIRREEPGR